MIPQSFQIVSGPSREILFDALRLVHEDRTVKFEWIRPDDVREEVELKVLAIGALGDEVNAPKGGQSWRVHAYHVDPDVTGDRSVSLFYSTQSRTGTIDFAASDLVGPSPLPVDDIGQEGLFVQFTRHDGFIGYTLAVGPFEDLKAMSQFFEEWTETAKNEDPTVLVSRASVIPGYILPVPPDQFTGLDMLPPSSDLEDFGPDEEDPDDPWLR